MAPDREGQAVLVHRPDRRYDGGRWDLYPWHNDDVHQFAGGADTVAEIEAAFAHAREWLATT